MHRGGLSGCPGLGRNLEEVGGTDGMFTDKFLMSDADCQADYTWILTRHKHS